FLDEGVAKGSGVGGGGSEFPCDVAGAMWAWSQGRHRTQVLLFSWSESIQPDLLRHLVYGHEQRREVALLQVLDLVNQQDEWTRRRLRCRRSWHRRPSLSSGSINSHTTT